MKQKTNEKERNRIETYKAIKNAIHTNICSNLLKQTQNEETKEEALKKIAVLITKHIYKD